MAGAVCAGEGQAGSCGGALAARGISDTGARKRPRGVCHPLWRSGARCARCSSVQMPRGRAPADESRVKPAASSRDNIFRNPGASGFLPIAFGTLF